ncbi:MAG: hypothetical protein K0S33_2979 [Bacteroidetes bacterium]|jgi:gliding motility-associated-like protein|nr:hypothetical protein [Bacteroidota bacterium]
MKRIITLAACICFVGNGLAQCLQVESILVDACNTGVNEYDNEMVRFKTGSTAVNVTQLGISSAPATGVFVANVWPTTSQTWHGIVQNAGTAGTVSALNATISGCGFIKEPPLGIIPANSIVILVTSPAMSVTTNSFATLNDTIYLIFQGAGANNGHFGNSGTGTRSLCLIDNATGCRDTVVYQPGLITGGNGGAVDYDVAGNPTYVNRGCQGAFVPLAVDAGAAQSGCANVMYNLAATVSGQYSTVTWSGGTGVFGSPNALATTYTPGAGESGPVTLTVTVNSVCGTVVTDNVTLTLTAAPQPVITSSNGSSVCQGDSVQLTATGGSSFTWAPGAIPGASIYVQAQGTYTVTSASTCGTNSSTFSLTVNPLPTVGVTTDEDTLCAGSIATLTASGAINYSWSSGTSAPTDTVVTVSPAATATYTVTGTDLNSCSDTASIEIAVHVLTVSSSATLTQPTCGNTDGDISGLSITGSGTYTYSWTNASSTVVSTSSSASNLAAGSYTVTVTDVTTTCTATQVFALSNTGGPAAPIFAASPTVCAGSNFTLTVTNPLAGAVYTWVVSGDTLQSGTDLTTINVSDADSSNTGTYTVEVNNGVCPGFSTVVVTLAIVPTPVITGDTAFCSGANTVLDASSSLPATGNTYVWYQGGTPISGATAATYTATTAGNYQVLVSNNGCDSLSAGVQITVFALPVVQVLSDTACTLDSTLLVVTGALTYSWSAGAVPAVGDSVLVSSLAPGTFTYTVTGTDTNGCVNTDTATVVVYAQPILTVTNPTVCLLDTATIIISGADTYAWAFGVTPSSGDTVFYVAGNTPGLYAINVMGTDTNGCFAYTNSFVTVSAGPDLQVTNASACINTPATFIATGADTYTWTGGTTPSTGDTVSVSAPAAGTYTYTVIGADGNSCSDTVVATLTVHPNPVITINGIQDDSLFMCINTDTNFIAGGAATYLWSTGLVNDTLHYSAIISQPFTVIGTDVNGCTDSTHVGVNVILGPAPLQIFGTPTICNGLPAYLHVDDTLTGQTYVWTNAIGTHLSDVDSVVISGVGNYTMTVTNACGSTPVPFTIGQSTIDVSFVPDTIIGLAPLSIGFTNTSVNATGFFWDFGNGITTLAPNPETVYPEEGTYTVFLSGSNAAYCYDYYTVTIIVLKEQVFITMPNIFSPNDDFINDYFAVKSYGIDTFNCQIYDRWGLLVTELQNVTDKWTPGSDVSEGTYFYIMTATGLDKQEFESKGTILLVR